MPSSYTRSFVQGRHAVDNIIVAQRSSTPCSDPNIKLEACVLRLIWKKRMTSQLGILNSNLTLACLIFASYYQAYYDLYPNGAHIFALERQPHKQIQPYSWSPPGGLLVAFFCLLYISSDFQVWLSMPSHISSLRTIFFSSQRRRPNKTEVLSTFCS